VILGNSGGASGKKLGYPLQVTGAGGSPGTKKAPGGVVGARKTKTLWVARSPFDREGLNPINLKNKNKLGIQNFPVGESPSLRKMKK